MCTVQNKNTVQNHKTHVVSLFTRYDNIIIQSANVLKNIILKDIFITTMTQYRPRYPNAWYPLKVQSRWVRKYGGDNTILYRVFTIMFSFFRLFTIVVSTFHHRIFTILVSLFRHLTIVISCFRVFNLYACRDGPNGTPYVM